MPLFEVAILEFQPATKTNKSGKEKLVFGPKALIAKDEQSAAIAPFVDDNVKVDRDRMTVLVRPFR